MCVEIVPTPRDDDHIVVVRLASGGMAERLVGSMNSPRFVVKTYFVCAHAQHTCIFKYSWIRKTIQGERVE